MSAELKCWALTPQGAAIARRIAAALGGQVCLPSRLRQADEIGFDYLPGAVAAHWRSGGHVFVAAAGIVVRCIAPLLAHKSVDPAVVVCDQNGRYAVSLLSGHLGRANELARRVAACLGGEPVITTATDSVGLPAFDVLAVRAGCTFADIGEVRGVSAALLEGKTVVVRDPLGVLDAEAVTACPLCRYVAGDDRVSARDLDSGIVESFLNDMGLDLWDDADRAEFAAEVVVTLSPLSARPGLLRLHPRLVHAGIGCRRGVPGSVLEQALRQALSLLDISPLSLAALATATLKADEPGLHEAGRAFGVGLRCFSAEELAAQPVPHPSDKAAAVLGVERAGVCEAAALLSAGPGASLLLEKQVFDAGGRRIGGDGSARGIVTVALARARHTPENAASAEVSG